MNKSGDGADSAKKVNGTDQQPTGIVQPTYKKLQDADSNWKANGDQIEMTKQNGTDADIDDGAQEKMLKDESKAVVTPSKNSLEQVKFGTSNGETKVDIEVSKPTMTGMGKEELMKFANDPFWVRIRWIMFAMFWILWFGMLAGAIAIILLAPKCVAPEPKTFWEESVMVDLDFSDSESQTFAGFTKTLDELKEHSVKSLSLPPIYVESEPGKVTDFMDVDKKYGGIEEFKAFLNDTNNRGQNVVLELNPHFSSWNHSWFEKSKKKEAPYSEYYIWGNASKFSDTGKSILPETESKTWKWDETRQQYYLFMKNESQPCLNYKNPMVVDEIKSIMGHWLKLGVRGFRLREHRLLIKEEPDSTHIEQDNAQLIKQLKNFVLNKTDGQGLLAFKESLGNEVVGFYTQDNAVDLIYTSKIVQDVSEKPFKPAMFGSSIQFLLDNDSKWPAWDLKRVLTEKKSVSQEEAENIMLFTMLLPGTTVLRKSDINDNNKVMFDELSKARTDPAFQYGNFSVGNLHNGTVIAYTRVKSGNPGFLVAYYNGDKAIDVDFSSMKFVPGDLQTLAYSSNYVQNGTRVQTKFSSKSVLLVPKSTLAMKFVPSSE